MSGRPRAYAALATGEEAAAHRDAATPLVEDDVPASDAEMRLAGDAGGGMGEGAKQAAATGGAGARLAGAWRRLWTPSEPPARELDGMPSSKYMLLSTDEGDDGNGARVAPAAGAGGGAAALDSDKEARAPCAASLLVAAYVWAELRREPRAYAAGVFTVFVVVTFAALVQNAVALSPLVFVKLSEDGVGEADLILTPGLAANPEEPVLAEMRGALQLPLINNTFVAEATAPRREVRGAAPRWVVPATAVLPGASEPNSSVLLLGIDSRRERDVALGREWRLPPLRAGHCYAGLDVLREVGLPGAAAGEDDAEAAAAAEGATLELVLSPQDVLYALRTAGGAGAGVGTGGQDSDGGGGSASGGGTASGGGDGNPFAALGQALRAHWNDSLAVANTTALLSALNASLGVAFPRIAANLSRALNLSTLPASFNVTLGQLLQAAAPSLEPDALEAALTARVSLTVDATFGSPRGKWPSAYGAVVVLEAQEVRALVAAQAAALAALLRNATAAVSALSRDDSGLGLSERQRERLAEAASALNATSEAVGDVLASAAGVSTESAALISVVMFRARLAAYAKDFRAMLRDVVAWSDAVAESVGVAWPATFSAPLVTSLRQTRYIRDFFDNILGAVMALVALLGAMLVYALLLQDVNARTYQYGMLRALGMRQRVVVGILLAKSLCFSLPGARVLSCAPRAPLAAECFASSPAPPQASPSASSPACSATCPSRCASPNLRPPNPTFRCTAAPFCSPWPSVRLPRRPPRAPRAPLTHAQTRPHHARGRQRAAHLARPGHDAARLARHLPQGGV